MPGPDYRYSEQEWEARVNLAATYRLADLFGMSYLIYNHITLRLPGNEERFLINRFGMHYAEVTASSLLTIDLDGNVLDGPIEHLNKAGFVIHSAVHGARPDARCVMHTHSTYGAAFSALDTPLLPLTQDGMEFHNRIGYHDFEGLAVDVEERERLVTDLGRHNALILRNHGLLTTGKNCSEAFARMVNLERACQAQILAMSTGAPLRMPTEESVEKTARILTRERPETGHEADKWGALVRLLDARDPSFRN
jgi:ribulose-5-phosphate 4-epimerase/fuculose-1-phosphate aldolase